MTAERAMEELWGRLCPDCGPTAEHYAIMVELVDASFHRLRQIEKAAKAYYESPSADSVAALKSAPDADDGIPESEARKLVPGAVFRMGGTRPARGALKDSGSGGTEQFLRDKHAEG